MKKLLFMAIAAFTMLTFATSCKKKISDADATTAAQEVLTKAGKATTVTVKDGVATLAGTCADDKCKAECETLLKDVKGVKNVVNGCTVTPIASIATTLTADVQKKVTDGLKDLAGLTLGSFTAKGVIINGTTNAAGKMKLMQMLASAKVLLDAASKITMK